LSQLISVAGGYPSTQFDTKIPSLADTANIVEAFKLYHYGVDNFDGSGSPAANSIEDHLITLRTLIVSASAVYLTNATASAIYLTQANASSLYVSDATALGYANSASAHANTLSIARDNLKADLASPALSGTPTAPTAAAGTNTTQIATTEYAFAAASSASANSNAVANTALLLKADIASPTLTGTPAAPTAAARTNTTQIATTAFVYKEVNETSIDTKVASYSLVVADAGKTIEMDVGSANDLTIPLNSSQAIPIGSTVDIIQYGAGQTTLVATGGVTVRSKDGNLKLTGQYSGVTLYKRGTDEWVAIGDLTA
jgi:hypothetical protein